MTEVYKKLYQTAGVERQESQVCLIVQAVHKTYGSTAMSQVEVKKLSMFGREANAIDGGIYIFHRNCFLYAPWCPAVDVRNNVSNVISSSCRFAKLGECKYGNWREQGVSNSRTSNAEGSTETNS